MGRWLLAALALGFQARASEMIWDTRHQQAYTVEEFAQSRQPGSVLVFGEQHSTADNQNDPGNIAHHARQVRLLEAIASGPARVYTGMEFLTYTFQSEVDAFGEGRLNETDFLKSVGWGANPFPSYRRQIQIPYEHGGHTLALNIPPAVSRQVAKAGPDSLNAAMQDLLPPLWERGGPEYFARFRDVMGGHVTPEQLENYFWAQSLWDDTMAWNALKQIQADPQAALVIIVGEFHAEFGHGLKARLLRQGARQADALLQVPVEDWKEETLKAATAPDPQYGDRADYLWLYSGF